MDARIGAKDPGGDDRHDDDLLWSFRRRGRVLLTGLPGGGKSTALTILAADWALHDAWAIPIAASLRRLAEKERFRKRPLRDELLDITVESVDPADRPPVREALQEALSTGSAVLFLDGLDEAADRSLDLARDIAQLTEEIHPDTDVLVATRDIAYADAQILGYSELRLGAPTDSGRAVEAVLRAVAAHRGVDGDADAWVHKRADWVSGFLRRDSQLNETPLMPVLLSLLAAESETDELPRTRSQILARVIDEVVRRREVKRDLRVSGIPENHEAEASLHAFPVISKALAKQGGSARRNEIIDQVAAQLAPEWGLAPAAARAAAIDIVVFWDESGIFVASGPETLVSPRLRLFLEIGSALHASSLPKEEQAEWVQETATRKENIETLVLAAGLSSTIADKLIGFACAAEGEVRDLMAHAAAEALAQGGRASDHAIRRLIERLLPLVAPGDDQAWKTFQTLVRVPVPTDMQALVTKALEGAFPDEHVTVGLALAALEWKWSHAKRDPLLEEGLRISKMPRLERRIPKTSRYVTIADLAVDQPLARVKENAAQILLPKRPELAQDVASSIRHSSFSTARILEAVLKRHGHHELVAKALKDAYSIRLDKRILQRFASAEEDLHSVVAGIAGLAKPARLTLSQERRLRELASFLETLDFDDVTAWISGQDLNDLRRQWILLIARLGGFDETVLAAQAQIVQSELAFDKDGHAPFFSLFGRLSAASLDRWNRVEDPTEGRRLALHLLRGGPGLAWVAARALASHPERHGTARLIAEILDDLPRKSKKPALLAFFQLTDGIDSAAAEYGSSRDPGLREAVASLIRLTQNGRPTELGSRLATDIEREVQLAALRSFEEEATETGSSELSALLENVASSPDQPFICSHCGTQNEASSDSCSSCHIVTEKPSTEAKKLLNALSPKTPL